MAFIVDVNNPAWIKSGVFFAVRDIENYANSISIGYSQRALGFVCVWVSCLVWGTDEAQPFIDVSMLVTKNQLVAPQAVQSFYENRRYMLAWSRHGEPLARAQRFLQEIYQLRFDGLLPDDYHADAIDEILEYSRSDLAEDSAADTLQNTTSPLAELDVLLSDAYFASANHLTLGKLNQKTLRARAPIEGVQTDLGDALEFALQANESTPMLTRFRPEAPAYRGLRELAQAYEQILLAGGWPLVTVGPTLQFGDRGNRVIELTRRLHLEGYGSWRADEDVDVYDETVERAVKQYQFDRGLTADGRVGPDTRRELNIAVAWRLGEMAPNLERWRWLPHRLGARYIVVNTAGYMLDLVDHGETLSRHRVVVGLPYRPTPEFSDQVRYLVFNPSWFVPPSIAVKDLLPRFRTDPTIFAQRGIRVFSRSDDDWIEADPATIDWWAVTQDSRRFPYRLRQVPGPLNPLGQVKFMFPNQYDVYLHDTPAAKQFDSAIRTFSSGCIRVERALELAAAVLRETAGWDEEVIARIVSTGQETIARLAQPLPIYIYYWTVWPAHNGRIVFRRDVYQRDAALLEALQFPIR